MLFRNRRRNEATPSSNRKIGVFDRIGAEEGQVGPVCQENHGNILLGCMLCNQHRSPSKEVENR